MTLTDFLPLFFYWILIFEKLGLLLAAQLDDLCIFDWVSVIINWYMVQKCTRLGHTPAPLSKLNQEKFWVFSEETDPDQIEGSLTEPM